jgi:hypothetical protein
MEDNGVRETDLKYREIIDSIIQLTIERNKWKIKNLHVLNGSTENRINQMKEALSL